MAAGCSPAVDFSLEPLAVDPCADCIDELDLEPPRAAPVIAVEPAPPAPPEIPCPPDWFEDGDRCEPFPGDEIVDCPPGSIQLIGDAACRPLGPLCPVGRFPEPDPVGRSVYVDPSAPPGGNGTRDRPFRDLGAALSESPAPDQILLSEGVHSVSPIDGTQVVHLRGACAARTELRSVEADAIMLTVRDGGSWTLEGLRLDAERQAQPLLVRGPSSELRLRGVEVVRAADYGIRVFDSALFVAEEVVVDDVRNVFLPEDQPGGIGVLASSGGSVELERSVVSRAARAGVQAQFGAAVRIRRSIVRDGTGAPTYPPGVLVVSAVRSSAFVSESFLARGSVFNVVADELGSKLTMRDTLIREGVHSPDVISSGYGVQVKRGASARLERVRVERAVTIGLQVDFGGSVQAEDLRISDTRTDPIERDSGFGLVVSDRSDFSGVRVEVVESRRAGIGVSGRSNVTLEDVRVSRSTPGLPLDTAVGFVINRSRVRVDRAAVEDTVGYGAQLLGSGVSPFDVTLEDLRVREVAPRPDGTLGIGVSVFGGGELVMRRVRLEGSGASAVFDGGVLVEGEALWVESSDRFGTVSLDARDGAQVALREVRVPRGPGIALRVEGPTTRVGVEGARLGDRTAAPLDTAVSVTDGELSLERAEIEHAAWGARVRGEARLVLSDVAVSGVGEPRSGGGVDGAGPGSVGARRLQISELRGVGLRFDGGFAAELESTSVASVAPGADADLGPCLQASGGAEVRIVTGRCEGFDRVGLVVDDAELEADRLLVRGEAGAIAGLAAQEGARVFLRRARLEGDLAFGAVAVETSTLSAFDLRLTGQGVNAPATRSQVGVGCAGGSGALLERFEIVELAGVGLRAEARCRLSAAVGELRARDAGLSIDATAEWDLDQVGVGELESRAEPLLPAPFALVEVAEP